MLYDYSTNPWDNFGTGISKDSELYTIGGNLFAALRAIGVVVAVVMIAIGGLLLFFGSRRQDGAKRRIGTALLVLAILPALPGIVSILGRITSLFAL